MTGDEVLDLQARVRAMIELWVETPEEAKLLIDADSWYQSAVSDGGGPG